MAPYETSSVAMKIFMATYEVLKPPMKKTGSVDHPLTSNNRFT
jgi:hypothetical protein